MRGAKSAVWLCLAWKGQEASARVVTITGLPFCETTSIPLLPYGQTSSLPLNVDRHPNPCLPFWNSTTSNDPRHPQCTFFSPHDNVNGFDAVSFFHLTSCHIFALRPHRSEPYDPYLPRGGGSNPANLGGNAKTAAIQAQIDDTVGIMRDNITKVAERGERLDQLQDKTGTFLFSSGHGGASATTVGLFYLDESSPHLTVTIDNLAISAQGFRRGADRVRKVFPFNSDSPVLLDADLSFQNMW